MKKVEKMIIALCYAIVIVNIALIVISVARMIK